MCRNVLHSPPLSRSSCWPSAKAAESCANPGTPSANIELVKKFYSAINSHAKPLLDEVLAKDWVDVPLTPGQGPGLEGMKGALDHYYAAFPDFTATNEDFVANADKVLVRSTIHATQKGDFAGIKATGKTITLMAMDLHQICNGRVIQTWHVEDWLSAMFEMGALPPKN